MKYIKLKKYKYQLVGDEKFELNHWFGKHIETDWVKLAGDKLTVKDGYNWDGASGPTLDTRGVKRASLAHDALYQLMRVELLPLSYRKKADKVLLELLLEGGMMKPRACSWYKMVRMFGKKYLDAGKPQDVIYEV